MPYSLYRALRGEPLFKTGFFDMMKASPAIMSWGFFTGVAMVKSGLSIPLALFVSLVVYAGSAQLATLPLLIAGANVGVIWFTAFVVNIRFIIFSAGMLPYLQNLPLAKRLQMGFLLGDMGFALQMQKREELGQAFEQGAGGRAYFLGTAFGNYFSWQLSSVLGIFLSQVFPESWGLEFTAVLALVALLAAFVKDLPTLLSLLIGGGVALFTQTLPLKLGLVCAVLAGMAAGIVAEKFLGDK